MTKKFFSALAAIAMLALSACTQEELNQFLNSVNSIKLDQTQVEMTVEETLNLIATVDPFKGDTKVVTWTSSSPEVASVEGTEVPDPVGINMPAGKVTALKEGETTITAIITPSDAKADIKWVSDNPKGHIVIPKEARTVYNIKPGDALLMLGDQKGMALLKTDIFQSVIDQTMEGLTK